jgi:glycosyltransferase involved in cell wall biosynthesis
MKILWLCGVPQEIQQIALNGRDVGAQAAWSWVMAHLPPPNDIELHIACPAKYISEDTSVEYKGAIFHLFPVHRGAVYSLYRFWMAGFRRVFEKIAPDWVHGWGVEAGFGGAAISLAPEKSSIEIQGILSDYLPYMKKSIPFWCSLLNERLTLRKGRRFIAEGEYSAREARKYTAGEVMAINQPLRDEFLRRPPGPGQTNQIVYLGTLADRKGIKDAVFAFAQANIADWKMLCIGNGEPNYVETVRLLIEELGVGERIELCGTLNSDTVVEKLQESPVFLLPTYMDTGPNALKEALAMGLWPICYDNSGPGEFIRRYAFGSLSETGNVEALATALSQVITEMPWMDTVRRETCVKKIRHDLARNTVWGQLRRCYSKELFNNIV